MRLIGLSVVAVLMAGCKTVGPDYQRPEVSLPATYAEGVSQVSQTIAENWWTHYQDPILNDLVGQALVNNSNIKLAVARIEEANALANEIGAASLPQVDLNGAANRSRVTESGANEVSNNPRNPVSYTHLDVYKRQAQWKNPLMRLVKRLTKMAR